MVNRRHPEKYVERILGLMYDDRPTQAKEILYGAQHPKDPNEKPIGPNTLYHYLKSMDKVYIEKLPKRKHKKEVYYLKLKNSKMVQISDELIKEKTNTLLKELPKEVQKIINLELRYMRRHEDDLTPRDEIDFGNEIAADETEIKRALSFVLLRHAFKLTREGRGVREADFYMNSKGKIIPKALVDKAIEIEKQK